MPFDASTATNPDTVCAAGCIAVFTPVPEPATLPLLAAALAGPACWCAAAVPDEGLASA